MSQTRRAHPVEYIRLFILGALTAGLLGGCDDTVFNTNPQASGIFLEDVLEIVDNECIACHAGVTADAGLDLSTDFCSAIYGRIVVPGEPDLSLMYLRMRSPSEPMPPSGRLSSAQIDIVKTWIEDGAECDGVNDTVDDTGEAGSPGKQVYDAYCAGCHGPNGEGVSAPAMTSVVPGLTADEVANIARSGSGGMPPVVGDPGEAQLVGEWAVEQWGD